MAFAYADSSSWLLGHLLGPKRGKGTAEREMDMGKVSNEALLFYFFYLRRPSPSPLTLALRRPPSGRSSRSRLRAGGQARHPCLGGYAAPPFFSRPPPSPLLSLCVAALLSRSFGDGGLAIFVFFPDWNGKKTVWLAAASHNRTF